MRSNLERSGMVHSNAIAIFNDIITASLFATGNVPGCARSISFIVVLIAAASPRLSEGENILDNVLSCMCISKPITGSNSIENNSLRTLFIISSRDCFSLYEGSPVPFGTGHGAMTGEKMQSDTLRLPNSSIKRKRLTPLFAVQKTISISSTNLYITTKFH